MKLYSGYYEAQDPFFLFDSCEGVASPSQLEKGGVLLLWGGSDISPEIYDQTPNSYVSATTPSKRDIVEMSLVRRAWKLGMPTIGICRGGQLLCAMNGGSLVQHVDGHHNKHMITTSEGTRILANSTHHQMMLPDAVQHELLAWSTWPMSMVYYGEDNRKLSIEREAEAVWFPKTQSLCIQGHPEYMPKDSDFVKYCQHLVKKFIIKE